MRLGIIGQTSAGKQAVFEALTGIPVTAGARNQDHVGTIHVPDERVDHLSDVYQPRKTTYAQVEYFLPGVGAQEEGGKKNTDLSANWTGIRNCDALIHILRNFAFYGMEDPVPEQNLNALNEEMILVDLIVVEKRLERLEKDQKRGKKVHPEEIALLSRCLELLDNGRPLRTDSELVTEPLLKGFAFLTAKPVLILFNNADDDPQMPNLPDSMAGERCLAIRGELEKELTQMDKEEAALFFDEFQIAETAADRVIQHSYAMMGLISFFTVGEDEVKAWTVRKDTPAVEAAGAIHSDIQKGFIRAEVLAYDDMLQTGSHKEARTQGLVRLEGKTYLVQDGDIINFRFNV